MPPGFSGGATKGNLMIALAISISGALAVAITARLMYLLFLGGKTISNATFIGRIVARLWTALVNFADGWREQNFGYKIIAYPCMLISIGLVSLLIYWFIPVISNSAGLWDIIRYCALIIFVGVSATMLGAFFLIYCVYLAKLLLGRWWRGENKQTAAVNEKPAATSTAAPAAPSDKTAKNAKDEK